MNPQRLSQFSAIVQAGSISKAATTLGIGKSVLSRQLAKLEDELGTRLIQRSTRRLTLTEIGELVYAQTLHIDRAVANIEQLTEQHQSEVKGRLRITCPRPLGQHYLVPLMVEFTAMYPKIEIVLSVEDRLVDLIADHIDVALRVAHLEDSTLVARKLCDNPRVLVASPAYLGRRGMPKVPTDLLVHDCLLYSSGVRVFDEWSFTKDNVNTLVRVPSKLQINDGMSLVAGAVAGGGTLVIDRLLVAHELADGSLVQLMPDYQLREGQPIYAVYPARPWLALKTSTFVTFLQERLFL